MKWVRVKITILLKTVEPVRGSWCPTRLAPVKWLAVSVAGSVVVGPANCFGVGLRPTAHKPASRDRPPLGGGADPRWVAGRCGQRSSSGPRRSRSWSGRAPPWPTRRRPCSAWSLGWLRRRQNTGVHPGPFPKIPPTETTLAKMGPRRG